MKKITKLKILFTTITLFFLSVTIQAQTDYTYTLIDNGSYSYTVAAVPSTTTSSLLTEAQGYGFTIFVPDGVGLAITSSLGNTASANSFNGDQVGGSALEDGYLITETFTSNTVNVAAPNDAGNNPVSMVTVQLTGVAMTGSIRIMANNGAESTALGGALQSFLTADTQDNNVFENAVINNVTGLSGTTEYSFQPLSVSSNTLDIISIYPNPTNGIVNIKGLDNEILKATVLNISGQIIITETSNLETIDMSNVSAGVYFLNIETKEASKIIKLVKE